MVSVAFASAEAELRAEENWEGAVARGVIGGIPQFVMAVADLMRAVAIGYVISVGRVGAVLYACSAAPAMAATDLYHTENSGCWPKEAIFARGAVGGGRPVDAGLGAPGSDMVVVTGEVFLARPRLWQPPSLCSIIAIFRKHADTRS
jgi:hypothetical protein